MPTTFGHVGIVAHDVDRLADFYTYVLGCRQVGPRRDLSGEALERGMGLTDAHVRGVHLAVPTGDGTVQGEPTPVLEIFALSTMVEGVPTVNRTGLMHLCFRVDDLPATLSVFLEQGGSLQGSAARVDVDGVGSAHFVYARDPEGNIVELQQWAETA